MAIELGGVELTPRVLAIGGAGVAGVFLLMSRNKSAAPGQTATLSPGEGLNWSDVIAGPDERGALIGAPGRDGEAGPPGIPGLPGTTPTPNPAPGDPDVDQSGGGRRRRPRRDRDRGDGGRGDGGNRQDNRSDREDRPGRDRRDRNRDDLRGPDKPTQNNRSDPPRVDDPRQDDPKRERRRANGRGGLREDERGDQGGNFNVDVSGGRERSRGRRARANADGGRATIGDVDKNVTGSVNANGGKAKADASGGNGNRTGQAAKNVAKRARGGRRGGEAFAGDDPHYQNGHGRQDGRAGAATLEVNTNPTPGGTIGGFFGQPSPLRAPHDVIVVKEGDTLSGLAQRHLGSTGAVERIYQLNRDLFVGNGRVLRAGMRLKV